MGSDIRAQLRPYYSDTGRPSIDPEPMIRMLIIGYCMGVRSERRLCDELHLNLAYRWFCRLGLEGAAPDHSTFSKNRHGRFRDSDLFDRTQQRFGIWPERLAADTGYGSAENLAWLVHEKSIEPHIPVFEKSARRDGTFGRADFTYNHKVDSYVWPAANGCGSGRRFTAKRARSSTRTA